MVRYKSNLIYQLLDVILPGVVSLNVLICVISRPQLGKISPRLLLHVDEGLYLLFNFKSIVSNFHAIVMIRSEVIILLIHVSKVYSAVRLFIKNWNTCVHAIHSDFELDGRVVFYVRLRFLDASIAAFIN